MDAPVLSQETLRALVFLFKAASFEMTSDSDPLGEKTLERHRLLQTAYAEVIKYIESVNGRDL